MSTHKVYVGLVEFIGRAEHSDAFTELLIAALDGDSEAREQLRATIPFVTVIGPEWFAEDEA